MVNTAVLRFLDGATIDDLWLKKCIGSKEVFSGKTIVDSSGVTWRLMGHRMEVAARIMPTHAVNLDALIRREDFEVAIDPKKVQPVEEAPKLKIVELEGDSFMFRRIRKPDFQRTTAHWPTSRDSLAIKHER